MKGLISLNKTRLRILTGSKFIDCSPHYNKLYFWHVCESISQPITVNKLIKCLNLSYKIYEQN